MVTKLVQHIPDEDYKSFVKIIKRLNVPGFERSL